MFSHLQINVRRHTILQGDEIISFMNMWNKPVCNWFICTREWAINFMMWHGTFILAFVKSSLCFMTWWGFLRTVDLNILLVDFATQWNVTSSLKRSCAVTPAPSDFSWCIQEISIVCICCSVLAAALTGPSKLSKANVSREDADCSLRQILLMATSVN